MQQSLSKVELVVSGEYCDALCSLLGEARERVDVVMFDWRWYKEDFSSRASRVNQAFVAAVRRGVEVRALVNYERIVPRLSALGVKAKAFEQSRLLHAKVVVVDRRTALVGSHNLTENAMSENVEVSVLLREGGVPASLALFFETIWQS